MNKDSKGKFVERHIPWNKGKIGIYSDETLRKMSESHKIHKWSRKHDCCIECGAVKNPHRAHGLCSYCYGKKQLVENRENELKYLSNYHKRNRDRERIQTRKRLKKWRQTAQGKESKRMEARNHYAKKKKVNFWTKEMTIRWEWIIDTCEGCCPKCGEPFDNSIHKCTMDHIIPLVPRLGNPQGIHHIDNVQVLCQSCNCSKNNKADIY